MKRILAFVVALAISTPAFATMNIRQNGDGTAEWSGSTGTKRFGRCAGGQVIQLPAQLNALSTQYGVSAATSALIRGVYGVAPGTTTGTAILKIYANGQVASAVRFFSSSTGLATDATLRVSAGNAGVVQRISTVAEVTGATGMEYNTVEEGKYIAVGSDGGATGLVTAQVFIQACPR
jgi:hypothetical protein